MILFPVTCAEWIAASQRFSFQMAAQVDLWHLFCLSDIFVTYSNLIGTSINEIFHKSSEEMPVARAFSSNLAHCVIFLNAV